MPTRVTVHPKKVLVNSNTDIIVFTCTAVTDPSLQLSYKWIHNEDILYNDTNHVVSIWSDNSLHLDYALADAELKERMLGDYKCVAESGHFSGSDTTLIEIEKVQERKSRSVPYNIHTIKFYFNLLCIDGKIQDYSISIANALEILQSCIKPSVYILCLGGYMWYLSGIKR